MNIFKIIVLDSILLLFPRFVYLIYLSTNKNIKNKQIYSTISLISSFYLVYIFDTNIICTIIILNSIIILSYLENKYIIANIFAIIIVIIYMNTLSYIWILLISYVVGFILYLNSYKRISNIIFVEIYIIISGIIYIILSSNINIIVGYVLITNIICYLNYLAGNILRTHMNYKELQKEKQIRMSLFKITHEIKNPIAVCKGYLDMLNVDNTNQVKKYIPIIKSEVERLLSILQDYLLINKTNLDLDVMDFNLLIEETVQKIEPLLKEKNIDINTELIEDEVFINGDYNRLSQVLINILKNSIEAIDCNMGKIDLKTNLKNNKYYIKIEDNGCGMTNDVIKKMKDPFYTTKLRGSGLGVSLIYEIVEAHGGKVEYYSEYGKGTKVILSFPLLNY